MEPKYASIFRRYFSSVIDYILLLIAFMFLMSSIKTLGNDRTTNAVSFIIVIAILFFYEPLLTSKACTIGQLITGVRVRRLTDLNRISFLSAFLRYIVKNILGIISFFTIPFSNKNRGLHDMASGSVVIEK